MTDFCHQTSRHKFVITVALASGSISLKGCLENPPAIDESDPHQAVSASITSSEQTPETTRVKAYIQLIRRLP
ncbi:MAG: hypothetical protein H0X31_03795 [Nostocaceae cyanobacterium]|nr:hypothetical protein [Nostocaceae cyanobacterium]